MKQVRIISRFHTTFHYDTVSCYLYKERGSGVDLSLVHLLHVSGGRTSQVGLHPYHPG